MFSHTLPSKTVLAFFFYTLLKFDVFNADVSFYKRGRNFETKAKSKKARHRFSKEVSWDIPANFQPIPLEDVRKRTENVHPSMQFSFIKKKTKIFSEIFMMRC